MIQMAKHIDGDDPGVAILQYLVCYVALPNAKLSLP